MDTLAITLLALTLGAAGLAGVLLRRARREVARVQAALARMEAKHQEERVRMERDRQAALEKVDAAERRFARVTDASAEAMLLVSPRGRVLAANQAAAALLGTPIEALVGASARDLVQEVGESTLAMRHDGARVPVRVTRAAWKERGSAHGALWLAPSGGGGRPHPDEAAAPAYNGS